MWPVLWHCSRRRSGKIHINVDCKNRKNTVILHSEINKRFKKTLTHILKQAIINKYNIPVPRYTSYPPANYFREMGEEELVDAIRQSNNADDRNLSFYLHMPFCRHLCHYCACNSYAMGTAQKTQSYIDALHREIDIVAPLLESNRLVSQIHYGGGSPTAMTPDTLKALNSHLLSLFNTIERPEIAVECHPGYLSLADWQALADAGFNRFSIGVQDFYLSVLHTVNRRPSQEPMEDIFRVLRDHGAGINLDFLYGLPGQTAERFARNIERAISLAPDRLVMFSYAHVPWLKKQQLILERAGLPTAEEKERIFDTAEQMLTSAGYVRIGMDHFVRRDDELFEALAQHRLHRNFQGYCTRRTTAQVYAFGVTGISQLETAYAQNTKDIDEYVGTVAEGRMAVKKGYALTKEQQQTRRSIDELMCNYRVGLSEDVFAEHRAKLLEMQDDGIVTLEGTTVIMTSDGTPFVRNVAALLDPLMKNTTKSFSKPI